MSCSITTLKVMLLEPYDGATELNPKDEENEAWAPFLSLSNPHGDEAMQAAAHLIGTHGDSLELVDWEVGRYALYRHLYRNERDHAQGCPNEPAEEAMQEVSDDVWGIGGRRLCGLFILITT